MTDESKTQIKDILIMNLSESYKNTDYNFHLNSRELTIRIGEENQTWSKYLEEKNFDFYFYITAYNPYSELKSLEENEAANQRLMEKLTELGLVFFLGVGKSQDSDWEEKSFCVVGGDLDIAGKLGNEFKQNAIVCGTKTKLPWLVFLRDMD